MSSWSEGDRRGLAGSIVGPLVVAAVAVAQLWPGLSNGLSPPITWDHGAHLGKAMLTAQELLPWLRGWTDRVELGVPLNTVYPVGGTLWILLWRAITFGALSWPQTYALAFVVFRCLVGLSVYRLARVAGAGWLAATLGGVMALADAGTHSEGGWFYDVLYGVWPMSLAVALFFFALAEICALADRPNGRALGDRARVVRAALILGASIFTHQWGLLGAMTLVPLFLITRWVEGRPEVPRTAARSFGIALLGVLVASFWLVPMLSESSSIADVGQLYWRSASTLGKDAVQGKLFVEGGPWANTLVVLGIATGLFTRGHRRFLALGAIAFAVVSTTDFLEAVELLRRLPLSQRIMYPRLWMFVKPMGFALAALALNDVFTAVAPHLRGAFRSARGASAALVAAALVLCFQSGIRDGLDEQVLDRSVTYTSTLPGWEDFLAFSAWMRAQPSKPYFRVGYHHPGSHLFQAAGATTGKPAHKMQPIVAEVFAGTTDTQDLEALRKMSVRYVVSWGPTPAPIRAASREVRRFGPIEVHELNGFRSRLAYDARGTGAPRVTNNERDRMVIEPRGARDLVVVRAIAQGWRARIDGRDTRIRTARLEDSPHVRMMRIAVPPGARRIELRYDAWLAADIVGLLMTLLGLAAIVVLLVPRAIPRRLRARRAALVEAIRAHPRWPTRPRRALGIAAGALALLFFGAVVVRAARRYDFVLSIDDARVEIGAANGRGAAQPCTTPHPDGGYICGAGDWERVSRVVQAVDGRLRSCIWAHPVPERVIRVIYPAAPLGGELRVGAGIADEAGGRGTGALVRVTTKVDGRAVGTLHVPFGRAWIERTYDVASGEHEVVFEISARDASNRFLCFDAVTP